MGGAGVGGPGGPSGDLGIGIPAGISTGDIAGSQSGVLSGSYGGYPDALAAIGNTEAGQTYGGLPGMSAALGAPVPGVAAANAGIGGPSTNPMLNNFFNAAQMAKGFIPNTPITGILTGVLTAGQALARGEDFGSAIGKGFTAFATNSIPFTGLMTDAIQGQGPIIGLGNLLGVAGQPPIGRGGEGTEGLASTAGNEPTGEPSMAPSPVAEAVAAPMLSSQPFGWYSQGMKRVNMPWVSQAGSQQLRYNQSGNYGGMKRV